MTLLTLETEFLSAARQAIEHQLGALIPPSSLEPVCQYSLFSGGKRFRPLLTLATVDCFGMAWKEAVLPACAIELIHTYSMIHDDLPCMDDDDFRRGKPTCHKAFSEWEAVLSGDALLTLAFQVLADSPFPAEKKVAWISILSRSAGICGMIEGQVRDLKGQGNTLNEEAIREIHRRKTGDLISASILFGAVTADVDRETQVKLEAFGQHLGLAFQLRDDVLDVTQSKEKHGDEIPSDVRNETSTAVTALNVDEASEWAKSEFQKAKDLLAALPVSTALLESVIVPLSKGLDR